MPIFVLKFKRKVLIFFFCWVFEIQFSKQFYNWTVLKIKGLFGTFLPLLTNLFLQAEFCGLHTNFWFYLITDFTFSKKTNFYGWLSSVLKPFCSGGNFWFTTVLAYSKDIALGTSASESWNSDCAKWILDDKPFT